MSPHQDKEAAAALLAALEGMMDETVTPPEKRTKRLSAPLTDTFVSAWLGQAGFTRMVMEDLRICSKAATVEVAIARLREITTKMAA